MTENLLQSAAGFSDSFFVSRLGLGAVAAVGISNALLQVFFEEARHARLPVEAAPPQVL